MCSCQTCHALTPANIADGLRVDLTFRFGRRRLSEVVRPAGWRGPKGAVEMATVTVGKENSTPVNLYYEDHGSRSPVWPHADLINSELVRFLC